MATHYIVRKPRSEPLAASDKRRCLSHRMAMEHSLRSDSLQPEPPSSGAGKPKKPPPITPRRFNRFFSPRSKASCVNKHSTSRSARRLQEITQHAINHSTGSRKRISRKSVLFADVDDKENVGQSPSRSSAKKRKALPTPTSSPPQSSPCKRARRSPIVDIPSSPPTSLFEHLNSSPVERPSPSPLSEHKPILRLGGGSLGVAGRILERSFGGREYIGRGYREDHCIEWQAQTSSFYSRPEDAGPFAQPALPFCSTACNTNSLVAIGDQTGGVRLIDSKCPNFASTHLSLQPHSNAVIDMAFSSDDLLLATASGDQTARIIDMRTQMTKYILQGHMTSVKQVRFQPGNDNVIATSSRDGDVNLWDLRCSPSSSVVTELKIPLDPTTAVDMRVSHKVSYAAVHTTISAAHADARALGEIPSNTKISEASADSSQTEKARRSGDVSVTALAFFSAPGRDHLLLTGSEASTTVKLWDIRARYSRRGPATSLSTTMQPESHSKHRHFGISTLILSTNNSRLYALSRDNTVYAYSTNHLILGHAPELSPARKPKYANESRTGLGPVYGFRHPKFHATSFYVKAALRLAKHDKPELLAVGSSDQCAVVFPTDESLFGRSLSGTEHFADSVLENWRDTSLPSSSPPLFEGRRPVLRRSTSGMSLRMTDTIPIFEVGSALVGGHQKEVTSLTWSFDGDLVSVGDDYLVRRWRENDVEARRLRVEGEGQGKRWGCGWAELDDEGFDDWDDE